MSENTKRLLALLMAISVLFSVLPVGAAAQTVTQEQMQTLPVTDAPEGGTAATDQPLLGSTSSVTENGAAGQYPQLSLGVAQTATFSEVGEYAYFAFTPTESARYRFSFTADNYAEAFLYDSGMKCLKQYSGSSFTINYSLTANMTYYLKVQFYYSDIGNIQVVADYHPIKSVVFAPVEIEEYTNGYWSNSDYYYYNNWTDRLSYIVTFRDGFTQTGTHASSINYNGQNYYCGYASYDQSSNKPWIGGNTYTASVVFDGERFPVYISIRKGMEDNGYVYMVQNGKAVITGCTMQTEILQIPETIQGYEVVGITSLGEGMRYAKEIRIPGSVTTLSSNLFALPGKQSNASSVLALEKLTIGSGISNLEPNMLRLALNLKQITVAADNLELCSYDGVLYNKDMTQLLYFPSAKKDLHVVPESVTNVDALWNYAYLCANANIQLGENVENCKMVDGIIYSEDMTKVLFCTAAATGAYVMPDSVTTVGDYAFKGSNLTSITISPNVTRIVYGSGSNAFIGSNIESITVPASVEAIDSGAFIDCNHLERINIQSIEAWCNGSFGGVLKYAQNLYLNGELVTDLVIPDSVTEINHFAFAGGNFNSVTIHPGVTDIESKAFENCDNLQAVYITDLNQWNKIKFNAKQANPLYYAKNLYLNGQLVTDLVLDSNVNRYAYAGSNIKSVTIQNTVTSVEDYAFSESGVEQVIIPGRNTFFAYSVFTGCNNLKRVDIQNLADWCSLDFEDITSNPLYYAKDLYLNGQLVTDLTLTANPSDYTFAGGSMTHVTVTSNVYNIGYCAFQNAALKTVKLSDGLTSLGDAMFQNCASLEQVTIGSGLTEISRSAFKNSGLKRITLPKQVVSVQSEAFKDTGLEEIIFEAEEVTIHNAAFEGCNLGDELYADNVKLSQQAHYGLKVTQIKIPEGVTSVTYRVFGENPNLVSISFPESLKSILWDNFVDDVTLSHILYGGTEAQWKAIDDQSSMRKDIPIHYGANGDEVTTEENCTTVRFFCSICNKWETVRKLYSEHKFQNGVCTICGFEGVWEYTLNEATGTITITAYAGTDTNVVIPDTIDGYPVTAMAENVFVNNRKITAVTLPAGLTEIPAGTFKNCIHLHTVTMGDKVTKVDTEAFYNCYRLSTINLPSNVTYFGDGAFYNCELIAPEISANTTYIGDKAFAGCLFTELTIPGTVKTVGSEAFADCLQLKKLTIGAGVEEIKEGAFNQCAYLKTVLFLGNKPVMNDCFNGCGANGFYLANSTGWDDTQMQGISLYDCAVPEILKQPRSTEANLGDTAVFATEAYGQRLSYQWYCAEPGSDIYNPVGGDAMELSLVVDAANIGCHIYCVVTDVLGQKVRTATVTLEKAHEHNVVDDVCTVCGKYCGTCGYELTWTLDQEGTLIISGTGAMTDYMYGRAPWNSLKSTIKRVYIEDGVTTIGNCAFADCSGIEVIDIAKSVTSIGSYAFYNCATLKEAVLPTALTDIGDTAFAGCTSLESVWMGRAVATIGQWAFADCPKLESIHLSKNLTEIGQNAFSGCTSLTSIAIPEGIVTIEKYTFDGCAGLQSVTIPGSVTSVGSGAFRGCTALTNVTYCGSAEQWAQITFGTNNDTLVNAQRGYHNWVDANCNAPKTCTICGDTEGSPVHKLENGICTLCWRYGTCGSSTASDSVIWSLDSEGTLTISGTGSMQDYESEQAPWYTHRNAIKKVIIEDGVTSIGNYAFFYCCNLTSVTIPDSVISIGSYAFYYCSSLTSVAIGNGVTSIGSSAFAYCDGLTGVTIPDSVTSLGSDAFFNCESLTSVTIGGGVNTIGDYAFAYCYDLTDVIIREGVTRINRYAFCNCDKLTNITIPTSVTNIDERAFYGCSEKLYSIYDNAKYLGDQQNPYAVLFAAISTDITQCTIHPDTKMIVNYAFYGCSALTSINIPGSVTSIGRYAFSGCSKLTSVIYCGTAEQWSQITINSGNSYLTNAKRSYHNFTADSCEAVKNCTFCDATAEPGHTWTDATCDKPKTCTACGLTEGEPLGHTVSNGICTVCKRYGTCGENLTWVLDNEGTLTISGAGVMTAYSSYSAPWYSVRSSVKNVVIENGVTSIGSYAFYYCSSLTSVTIPDSVTSIGSDAFYYCSSLTSVTIPDSVTSIGSSAFAYCDGLTGVTIPDSVTSIGSYAFRYCDSLTGIWVDSENAKYASDSYGVLFNKDMTTLIAMPGGFSGAYTIPDGVTSIGSDAFAYCDGLTSVTIPDSVTSIGSYAFYDCDGLTSVAIGNGVTSIGSSAFRNCKALTGIWVDSENAKYASDSYGVLFNKGMTTLIATPGGFSGAYTIPDGVTSIGSHAFYYCSSLTSVTIGNSVTSIGSSAFYNCSKLSNVTYCGTAEQWGQISINSGNASLTNATRSYHNMADATCEAPKTCTICGATEGEALGHTWVEADCTAPKTCVTCGATEGTAVGHLWISATCTESKTCFTCGITEGEPLGHSWSDDADSICNGCGETRVVIPIVDASLNVQKHTMQITSDLKLGFSINIADVQNASDYYVVFKKIDGITAQNTRVTVTKEEIEANGTSGTRYYAYYPKVLAGEMNDKIQATLYVVDADGIVRCSQVDSYSVVDYLVLLMSTYENYPSYVNYMTVAVELLNYGTEAQKNFGYKVDTPANAVVFANGWQGYALAKDPVPQNNRNWGATNNSQKVIFKGSGLKLEESIYSNIRVDVSKLTAEEFANLKMVVKAGDGTIVQTIESKDFSAHTAANNYYITITKILPKDMSKIYTLEMYVGDTLVSSTATYSVESYVRLLQDSGLSAGAVALAALRYGTAAALLG